LKQQKQSAVIHIFCAKPGSKQVQNKERKNLETALMVNYLVVVIDDRSGKTPRNQLKKKQAKDYKLR
jgi:hypothetical protein